MSRIVELLVQDGIFWGTLRALLIHLLQHLSPAGSEDGIALPIPGETDLVCFRLLVSELEGRG